MATEKTSIKEQLVLLAELQQIDTGIACIEKELTNVQCQLDKFEIKLMEMNSRLTQVTENLDQLRKQYRSDESEIRSIDDAIVKTQSKLNAVKTNKEYQAMLKAIDDLKLKRSDMEDRMLASLEQIEGVEGEKRSLQADYEDLQAATAEQKDLISQNAEVQKEKCKGLQQEHELTWNQLPVKWQTYYRRAVQQGRGIGVAPVIEAVCQVCRVNLPPQLYIDLMRMQTMLLCPSCQRIIYPSTIWDGEHKRKSDKPQTPEI